MRFVALTKIVVSSVQAPKLRLMVYMRYASQSRLRQHRILPLYSIHLLIPLAFSLILPISPRCFYTFNLLYIKHPSSPITIGCPPVCLVTGNLKFSFQFMFYIICNCLIFTAICRLKF